MTASSRSQRVEEAAAGPSVAGLSDAAPRAMRADAVKNRQRILEAAEATFAAEGVSAPIDAVAQRAGVGVGTVYRHFPTKEALFEAIVITRLNELYEATIELAGVDDPGAALFSFLEEFGRQASAKQDLFDALNAAGIDVKSACATRVDDLKRGIDLLMERAKSAGAVRPHVCTDEVVSLISGACHSGQDDAACQRMVEIVCDGIRVAPPESPDTSP